MFATGAITCTGFVHNLLRRHPACQVLLHRPLPGAGPKSATSNTAAATHIATSTASEDFVASSRAGVEYISASGKAAHPTSIAKGSDLAAAAPSSEQSANKNASGQPSAAHADVRVPGHDPYNAEEPDPAKSQALASSLWEVESLRAHYCPQVLC